LNSSKSKVFILLVAMAATLMVTTACQPTPGLQAVVGVNDDTIEQILTDGFDNNDSPIENHSFVEIEVPKHITTDYIEIGKMKLAFNADIIVPETTAYPVVEVTKRTFSDEYLLALVKRFAGSNDELYSEWNLTKQDWIDKQIKFKQKEPDQKLAPDYLNYLQQMQDEAEEEVQNPLVKISELSTELFSPVFVRTDNGTVALFMLSRDGNDFAYFRDMNMEQAPASLYGDDDFDEELETIEQFNWRQPKEPEISQDDAFAQALKYIDELKIDLDLYEAEPCTFLLDVVEKSVGWKFTFTRKLSDAQVQYDLRGFCIDKNAMPSYAAPWNVEVCKIGIDKDAPDESDLEKIEFRIGVISTGEDLTNGNTQTIIGFEGTTGRC